MNRAFVTGGSGFLGGHLIRALRERGDEVMALARSETAVNKVEQYGAVAVKGDLGETAVMQAAMQGCTAVYHCAAQVGDWGDPEQFHRVNVQGTENVIKAAKNAGVTAFVHVSTEAVLVGDQPLVNVDEQTPYPAQPMGLYALTKGEAERRVIAANSEELKTVVVRPRAIWGIGDTVLLPRFVDMVGKGQFMWISQGQALTSTCHVRNVVEGMLLAAEKGRGGEIYFLTDGKVITTRAFINGMLATQGLDGGTRSLPFGLLDGLTRVIEWVWRTFRLAGAPPLTRMGLHLIGQEITVDDSKARRELGYRGHVSWEQGLKELKIAG